MRTKFRPQQNSVLALGFTLILFAIAGFFFDFYYDLNDDVLIKDIVSGAYSGRPDAHSIQMLYPLSFVISLLYKVVPLLPWQGLFLCGAHGLCFYLIAKRSLFFAEKVRTKILLLVTEAGLLLTLFLWEMVLVQYTITSAMLVACACFLVFTSEKKKTVWEFFKAQLIPMLLVLVAFMLRSEMMLLMSPFIALTGIFKWSEEESVFAPDTLKKYLGLAGTILLGMGLTLVIDGLAYSSEEWRTFRDFFDARTRVYDYTWYPDYEEAEQFYKEIGLSQAQVTLIDNYNFGLDEAIDAEDLWNIAAYKEENGTKAPLFMRMKEAFADYRWRTFHEQDAPYNFFVLMAYGMVLILAVLWKDKNAVWKLPLMVVFRTIPWMYVILAKRVPNRISHPLYYMELLLLGAWILQYIKQTKDGTAENMNEAVANAGQGKHTKGLLRAYGMCAVLFLIFSLIRLPLAWKNVDGEMLRRESVNAVMEAFDEYAKAHPDNYYYMDVYSTVDFSEKMFLDVDNSQKNYDILGGWADRSPLQKKATSPYHKDELTRAELLLQDNFYFVCEQGRDIEFLEVFYSGHGMVVSALEKEVIATEEKTLVVYQIQITANKIN